MVSPAVVPAALGRTARRSRLSVCVLFTLMGTTTGSWAARIPSVRAQMSLNDAQWGLANVSSTVGSVLALSAVFLLIGRVGPRRLALTGAPLLLIITPLTATSTGPVPLVLGLLVQGAAAGLLATPMNVQAVEVEREYGRRIMSSFHACFSLGQLTGGVIGTFAARADVRPSLQLACSGIVLGVLLLATFRRLPADVHISPVVTDAAPQHRRRAALTRQLLLLALIALLASINEGTAVQWSATYATESLHAGPGAGAITFTCFSVAMAVSRLFGDRAVNRLGQRRFLLISELVVAAGLAAGLTIGTPWAGYLGFALVGVGSGCVIPTMMGLAGNQPGVSAGHGASIISFGQWPAYLFAPPLIGLVSSLVGLRFALFIVVGAALGIVALSTAVRVPPAARHRGADTALLSHSPE